MRPLIQEVQTTHSPESLVEGIHGETGVVLLPGNGFEVVDTSARISLANLTEVEYAAIGKFTRQILDECHQDFKKTVALQ